MTKDQVRSTEEALKLALEALEYIDLCDNDRDFLHPHECFQLDTAITAIKQALNDATPLAAPVQEPVAWINAEKRTFEWNGPVLWNTPTVAVMDKIPLYTTPPNVATPLAAQPALKPLTDEQVEKIIKDNMTIQMNLAGIRQDFEAAHGIKEKNSD